MIRYFRELRLIPIALIASVCLLALKIADLALHSSHFAAADDAPLGYADVSVTRPVPDATQPPGALLSWAQQMFNFPNGSGVPPLPSAGPNITPRLAERDLPDITGSVTTAPASSDAKGVAEAKAVPPGKDAKPALAPGAVAVPAEGTALPSGAERAILERLQERRQELDTRARELDIRESLIQGAEKRMDARLSELKDVEGRIKVETQQKDDAEAARLKGLVTMYESMKPRDAAKIFDGLDSGVLIEMASLINPRTMAEILAQMSAEVAQHLTAELASKAKQVSEGGPGDLPKIQGQQAQ
jgi:flagellar motility protein MotE (MotC chaperone)